MALLQSRDVAGAGLGTRVRAWIEADRSLPLVLLLATILAAMVVPPMWFLLQGSLHTTNIMGGLGDFTFDYYRQLVRSPHFLAALCNSIVFAVGAALFAIALGGSTAWLVERTNVAWKWLAYVTALVSLGTPYMLYVVAWIFLLGKEGPVNDLFRWATGSSDALVNVFSMAGMILVEGCLWSPMAFLLLGPVFRMGNADYEEAARMAGAGLPRTIVQISMRLAAPAFLAIILLAVVRAIESFEVPILIGGPGNVPMLTTDIFVDIQKRVPPDLGQASAFGLVLLVLTAFLIYLYSRITRSASRYHTVTGKAFRPRTIDLGAGRWLGTAIIVLNAAVVLLLPIGGLIWLSLMPFTQSISISGLHMATFKNYIAVLHSARYLELAVTTFAIAAGSATVTMTLMLLSAWLGVRRRRFAWILDQLAMVPLAFPGLVLGVAMLQLFLSLPFHIYGTIASFIFAYSIRFLPYGIRYAQSGIIQIHGELEEAAGVAGATQFAVVLRILLPLALPAVLSGWLFIFLIATRDLALSILLASPRVQPVSVTMFDLWSNGQSPELAAFGLIWTLVMMLVALALYFAARRSSGAAYGVQ